MSGNTFTSFSELIPYDYHDRTIFTKLQIGETGHIALTIQDAIHAAEAVKVQAVADFLDGYQVPVNSKFYDDSQTKSLKFVRPTHH